MTPLRESYLIDRNEQGFDSLFAKINLYNFNKVQHGKRLNESKFNSRFDIPLSPSEQKSVKDFFRIVESKMLNTYAHSLNEGAELTAKVKRIKQFFEALSQMVIGTVSDFINKIIEMLNKLGQKVSEFIDSVFGFDGFENFKPKENAQVLNGIPQEQLGFIGAVEQYCTNNLKSAEIKQAAQELGSVNEGFSESLDNWLKNSKVLNSKIGKLILGDREKVGGGKISLWKTIGVSIIGSLLLCTIIPMLVTPLGGVGVAITVACKIIWISRGVLKVLHHRSKTKKEDQSLWNFWTVFQILLVVGIPLLFAIPSVKEAVNAWMMEQIKDLGLDEYAKKIAEYFGSGETREVQRGWKEIVDPDAARNAVIGHDAVADAEFTRHDTFRAIYKAGGNVFDYIKKVVSDIGLDHDDANALSEYMKDFNELRITGPDVYDHVFGKLENCKTLQLGFDTSIVKRTFGTTQHFYNVLFDKFKEEGINVNQSKFYNLINQEAWERTSGNRGAIDVLSLPDVKASAENIEAVNKVLKNILGDSTVAKGHTVIGVLNSPVKFTKTVADMVKTFIPKWDFGAMYMPMYNKAKQGDKQTNVPAVVTPTEKDDKGAPIVTPTPSATNVPMLIMPKEITPPAKIGFILHNVEKNKDYQITEINHNVKLSEVRKIFNTQPIEKGVDAENNVIDIEYEEVKENVKKLRAKRLFEATEAAVLTKDKPTLKKADSTELALKEKGDIIKSEQNVLASVSKGDISVTVFYSNQVKNKIAAAFCSPCNLAGFNPIVAETSPSQLFKKGLFKYYTFRTDKENEKELRRMLTIMMFDSVMKTYEILKFTASKYQLIKEENGLLKPGEKALQGNIPILGNFTVQEFCDIHNNKVDPYIFYDAKYADDGATVKPQEQKQLSDGKQSQNQQQTAQKNTEQQPQSRQNSANQSQPNNTQQVSQNGSQNTTPSTNTNHSDNTNADQQQTQQSNASARQSANTKQLPPSNKKQTPWYKRFWNWLTNKKNESFDPNKKLTSEELYEYLKLYNEFKDSERV